MGTNRPETTFPGARYRRRAQRLVAATDIGNEPPLNPVGLSAPRVDRRAVSPRWFFGAVLTGVCGIGLIGSAIYVSLESNASVLRTPEMVNAALRPTPLAGAPVVSGNRGDRLVRFEIAPGARQAFRMPVTLRAGSVEVIKARNFVRIATPLSMTVGQYASDIPAFNPLQMFTDAGGEPEADAQPEVDVSDAEVSLVKSSLTGTEAFSGAGLSEAEAAAQVQQFRQMEATRQTGGSPVLPLPPQLMLSRSLAPIGVGGKAEGQAGEFDLSPTDNPFSRIEVHVIPENLTVLAKSDPQENTAGEELVTLGRDDNIETALRARGASDAEIRAILRALAQRVRIGSVGEGARLRILMTPAHVAHRRILRVMVITDDRVDAIAALDDHGEYVAVEPDRDDGDRRRNRRNRLDEDDDGDSGAPRLYASLYETGLKNGLSRETVANIIRIFAYEFDMDRHISPSDRMEVFMAEDEDGASPELLFAALTVDGETRGVYRYQMPDGTVEYFDRDGKSLKKFLLRKPISEGVLRSGFGMRRHPILGYSKMHTGVDWANKVGTPILAAGDGIVTKAGWHSGYGRHTEIQHKNGYVTTYSHQSAFAKNIRPGVRVRQGQVIGYLGSSGLSTGPHLHYEVLINGRFVNPMRIKVPRGGELDGAALADFRRTRQQVDELMEKASAPRVATTGAGGANAN
ncbi:M23 family metallopeptidase [Camelimonas abortus]|uniref:M23 family metallopeptidase n=1 Tax=Camelimonas abortus TaxID=1017184 RepID=A0ABV7LIC1_9HYPH